MIMIRNAVYLFLKRVFLLYIVVFCYLFPLLLQISYYILFNSLLIFVLSLAILINGVYLRVIVLNYCLKWDWQRKQKLEIGNNF